MNWIQIFDVLWLTGLLALLLLIWRSSERARKQDKENSANLTSALIEVAQKDAESARKAAQAAQDAVSMLKAGKSDVL